MPGPLQLPDPDALRDQLEQAQAARSQLDRIVAWLEEGIQIFAPAVPPAELEPPAPSLADEPLADEPLADEPVADEPVADPSDTTPAPATEPRRASAAPRVRPAGPAERDRQAKVLHALIQSGRKLTKDELAALTGFTKHELTKPLQQLVADERIIAEGATKSRRYRAPKLGEERGFHSDVRERQEKTARRNAAKVTDAVARVGLRDRVMKAILADSDALNEDRLALALNADRGDVAEACGWLLERHRVQLNPDGTYRRAAGREAA